MTKQEVGSLAFKLMGIYALVHAAQHATYFFMWISNILEAVEHHGASSFDLGTTLWTGFLVGFPALVLLALGIFLLVRSGKLSAWTFPDSQGNVVVKASAKNIQAVAFSVVGVLLFVSALPSIAQLGINIYSYFYFPEMKSTLIRGNWITFITMSAKVILGIALFFSGRSLSNFWFKMRTFRQPPQTRGESEQNS